MKTKLLITTTFFALVQLVASHSKGDHPQHRVEFPDAVRQSGDDRQAIVCWNATAKTAYLARSCPTAALQVAKADCRNSINQTGLAEIWAYLELETNGDYPGMVQSYAAGMVEAAVTLDLMTFHIHNTYYTDCINPKDKLQEFCQRLTDFLADNMDFMKHEIENNPDDPYWEQVSNILYQLSGLEDTYLMLKAGTGVSDLKIDMNWNPMLLYLQLGGDLEDLEPALGKPKEFLMRKTGYGHCSALIKVVDDGKDVLVAHDTWSAYQSMLRIIKYYRINIKGIPSKGISFSSYPGTLPSIDDFYITSAGLVVTETTIGNSNAKLWSLVKPQSILTWVRSQVANRLATDARMWARAFAIDNSGTYNNQWMILDYKQLQNGVNIRSATHFLWVVEQIPGTIMMADQTAFLHQHGFWPSYNVPFYPEIFNKSGGWEKVAKYGDWYTYDKTPRALIFKRNATQVTDMQSLSKLMRYNDYTHDPLSKCNCTPPYSAENAIASRSDLNPANGTYPFASLGHRSHGSIDMKAANKHMVMKQRMVAISGPTFDQVPEFSWSTADFAKSTPHMGHPETWHFDPILIKWSPRLLH